MNFHLYIFSGTSTPLGELFDHGCDAFSTVFVIIAYGIATGSCRVTVLFFTKFDVAEGWV